MIKDQINRVEQLVAEVEATHRYSMSRIYNLSNEIFGRNETPQSCSSCLIRKVNELKEWLKTAKGKYGELNTFDVLSNEAGDEQPAAPVKKRTRRAKKSS